MPEIIKNKSKIQRPGNLNRSWSCNRAITESQQLIDHALELERKGGRVDMCNALEELKQEGVQEGVQKGIRILIRTYKDFNVTKDSAVKKLMEEFSMPEDEAVDYVNRYWQSGD